MKKKLIFFVFITLMISLFSQWESQNSGVNDNIYGVHFLDENNGYAVGWGASAGGVALKTTNGGENWDSTILSNNSFVFSVTFLDENNGFAAGCLNQGSSGAIFHTTNAGDSWTITSQNSTYGFYDIDFPTSQIGFACGWLGKIFKTTNGGNSWSSVNSGTTDVLRWMHFVDENTGYIVGGTNWNNPNKVFKTTNGGSNWTMVKNFGSLVVGGIHFFDETTGVICGGNSGEIVKKTYDGGVTWEDKYNNSTGLFQSLQFSETGIGWICGNNGRVIHSLDYGETWSEIESASTNTTLLSIYGVDEAVFTVGTSGAIFKKALNPGLIADFSADAISGSSPLTVNFTDETIGDPMLWFWDFDNDGIDDSYAQNPQWIYSELGLYTVSLTVYDSQYNSNETKIDYIEVFQTSLNEQSIQSSVDNLSNFPNPFNPSTTISFSFPKDSTENAELLIYNLKGQEIRQYSIFDNKSSILWDGKDKNGEDVSSGIYFYKLGVNSRTFATKKCVLLK